MEKQVAYSIVFGLKQFRAKNVLRCNISFHPVSDWSETDWATAMAGECGEACNLIKKRRRGESVSKKQVADELADLVTYADLLASKLGINLGEALVEKFNEISDRIGSQVKI